MISKQRQSFLWKCLVITVLIVGGGQALTASVKVAFDAQAVKCIPEYSVYLINLWGKTVERDKVYSFSASGLKPYFDDGTKLIKYARGVPGDHLQINSEGVRINGELVAQGLPLAGRLGKDESFFSVDEVIPDHSYLFLGSSSESYDGRYWGYVSEEQIFGRGYPIM